jgi:hypothetical protein
LNCTPELIVGELDPVTNIDVRLNVTWQNNGAPQITYFDAWHLTAKGNTYKRSQQYLDRYLKFPNVAEPRWVWEGHWTKDRSVLMTGQLAMTRGVYAYKEWIFHGDPGPQSPGEEVTSSVCREVQQ